MAALSNDCRYQKWDLTEQEYLQGSCLTITQKQCIQNQIAQLAEERLALNLDPEHPLNFIQKEAEIKGQLNALSYLIDLSTNAEKQLHNPQPSGEE
jgi:hypothetical protein